MFSTSAMNVQGRSLSEIVDGTWDIQPLLSRLNDLVKKETGLENLSIEMAIPTLGKGVVESTARKLLIPSGRSTMILLSVKVRE